MEYSDDYARSVAKNSLWYLDLADSHEIRPAQVATYNAGLHARQALTNLRELYQSSDLFRNSGDFRISPSNDKVKHVFIYAQREKNNDMTENPYIFDTFKLNAADDMTRRKWV